MTKAAKAKVTLIAWWAVWPLFHIGAWLMPVWFFQQVLVGLSVYAVVATKQDDYHTIQAKAATEKQSRSGPSA